MNSEYLVVLSIEKMSVGDTYPQGVSLPLHCTVMPWFQIDSEINLVHLQNKLMLLACGIKELELVAERPDMFGPNTDIPVYVLRQEGKLNLLHTEILIFLAGINSTPKDISWIGAGYRPHMTNTNDSLALGGRYSPRHLVLVERGGDKIKVVKSRHKLGDIPF